MVLGLLLVGFAFIVVLVGLVGLGVMGYVGARSVPKRLGRTAQAAAFLGFCALPFLYAWAGQFQLQRICEANAGVRIIRPLTGVEGFSVVAGDQYELVAPPVFGYGFRYIESNDAGLDYKYRTFLDGHKREVTYSNEMKSQYEVRRTQPTPFSPLWSIYSSDLVVRERATQREVARLTDYLWGAPRGTLRALYVQLFVGRSFLSCGPGLAKGLANDGLGGQKRQDEYNVRDAQFLRSALGPGL